MFCFMVCNGCFLPLKADKKALSGIIKVHIELPKSKGMKTVVRPGLFMILGDAPFFSLFRFLKLNYRQKSPFRFLLTI